MGTTGVPRRHAIWQVPLVLVVLALLASWIVSQLAKWPPPPPQPNQQTVTTHRVHDAAAHVKAASDLTDPSVLVIGDSYAAGSGATSPDHGWVAVLGDALGWRVKNLARKGAAYTATSAEEGCVHDAGCDAFATVVAEAGAAEPDLVLVTGSRKDVTTDGGIAAARSLLSDLDAGQPLSGHPELIVGGSAGTKPNDAGHEAIAQAIEQALLSSGLVAAP